MNSVYDSFLTPFSILRRSQSVEYNTATFQLGYELDVFDIHYGFVPFVTIAGQNYLRTHKPWDQKSAYYVQIEAAEMSSQVL
jgi:hypothetical protein